MNLFDAIMEERKMKIESGVFCCDDCGDEYAVSSLVETDEGELICSVCEQEREDF